MSFIEYLENCYEDDEFMDEEILEALHENTFHHWEEHQEERVVSLLGLSLAIWTWFLFDCMLGLKLNGIGVISW